MDIDPTVTRRSALVAGLAGAGALTLAACSSSSSGSAPDKRAADVGGGAPAAAPGGSGGSADPGTTAGGSSGSSGGAQLAQLDTITVGQAVSATLDGKPVIVARPSSDTAACFSAICTHMGCTVAPAGTQLHCPCHGSVYNATTGKVLQGPAPAPLPRIAVKVVNGDVVAG
jgi:Rieske Fe-S protein